MESLISSGKYVIKINNIEKETKNSIVAGVTQIHKIVRQFRSGSPQKYEKYAFLDQVIHTKNEKYVFV